MPSSFVSFDNKHTVHCTSKGNSLKERKLLNKVIYSIRVHLMEYRDAINQGMHNEMMDSLSFSRVNERRVHVRGDSSTVYLLRCGNTIAFMVEQSLRYSDLTACSFLLKCIRHESRYEQCWVYDCKGNVCAGKC